MNIEENPNYLVMSADDYIKMIAKLVERAGISLGVTGAIATTGVVLMNESNSDFATVLYTYIVPLIFVGLAFIVYAKAFTRPLTLVPYSFVYGLAAQNKLWVKDKAELKEMKKPLNTAKTRAEKKKKEVDFGDGSLISAILLAIIVNIINAELLTKYLDSNPIVVGVLLVILGALGTVTYYNHKRSAKPLNFAHNLHFRLENPQSVQPNQLQVQLNGQQAIPEEQQIEIQLTPEQLAQLEQVTKNKQQ